MKSIILSHYFNKLPDDAHRWKFVKDNQDKNIMVHLDNDDTFITIEGENGFGSFDEYIGNSYGVVILLEFLGIQCDLV